MEVRRGRRRKIEAEDLSLFGEYLEDIFKSGNLMQRTVALAGNLDDSTLSQMKVGVRMSRNNVLKLIEGLVKVRYLTHHNFEVISTRLLELADESPINRAYKKDGDIIEMLSKLQQNNLVFALPALECIIEYDDRYNYRVMKIILK